ncbi:hypothetical protein ACS0TY_017973 [Phlomoides rotata]
MGHYARLLIEIDIKSELVEKLMYRRGEICSFDSIVYERLPTFCRKYGIMGHVVATCSRGRGHVKENKNRGRSSSSGGGRHRSSSHNK